jgi:Zn-dependent peptidase ImmA (M78 family)
MTVHTILGPASYDPWRDLEDNWPQYQVVVEPMEGDLLGVIRSDDVIALRADSSSSQQRCTLAHEIVHLERGLDDCGPWQAREEAIIEAEVAQRLIPFATLARALRAVGGDSDLRKLGAVLEVDQQILAIRLGQLTAADRRRLRRAIGAQEFWSVA